MRDFSITVDDQPVEIDEVNLVKDVPVTVFVLLDAGVTMQGERFRLAGEAISNFIKYLSRDDKIAIFGFNHDVYEMVPLTDNLNLARDTFESAINKRTPTGASCLYDAIYSTLEKAKSQPAERRAIIVLSSRKDTITGSNACSSHTLKEIENLSDEIPGFLPIHTIGIGSETDSAALKGIAEATGGVYASSTVNAELTDLFKAQANRLLSEYQVIFTSTDDPGQHTLTVQLDNQATAADLTLPGLPPVISIAHPSPAEEFEAGPIKIVLSLVERGVYVNSISFEINGMPIGKGGKLDQPPYEQEIDFSQYDGQLVELTVIAQDKDGKTLAATSMEFNFGAEVLAEETAPAETTPKPQQPLDDQACPEGKYCLGKIQLSMRDLALIGAILVLTVIAVIVAIILAKKKKGKPAPKEDKVSLLDEATLDSFTLPGFEIGRLTILSSDDPMLVGKEYQLMKSPTTIGRSVNNDIALPKDSAVSRNHLEIIADTDGVALEEIFKTLSDGTRQPPTYGTYINDRKVTGKTTLHTGDEISLGRRTKLRYEGPAAPAGGDSEEVTIDQIQIPDFGQADDSTRDG